MGGIPCFGDDGHASIRRVWMEIEQLDCIVRMASLNLCWVIFFFLFILLLVMGDEAEGGAVPYVIKTIGS